MKTIHFISANYAKTASTSSDNVSQFQKQRPSQS